MSISTEINIDIYVYLKNDHQFVSDLFDKLIASKSNAQKSTLLEKISQELLLHISTEEKTFYQALKKDPELKEKLSHANKEHDEIKDYIKKISVLSPDTQQWMEMVGEFKHSVEHHVDEEETDIFKKAKKFLSASEAKALAQEMDDLKRNLTQA